MPSPTNAPTTWIVLGLPVTPLLTCDESAGGCSVFEVAVPPGAGVGPHVHSQEDETFILLAGLVELATPRGVVVLRDLGATFHAPRGMAHALRNPGPIPAKLCVVTTPGGFERFFHEMHATMPHFNPGSRADLDRAFAIMARYGMTPVEF